MKKTNGAISRQALLEKLATILSTSICNTRWRPASAHGAFITRQHGASTLRLKITPDLQEEIETWIAR